MNAVSPGARTRLSAGVLDAGFRGGGSDGLDLDSGHVARLVVHLVSPAAHDVNGRVIHAAGGVIREYTTTRTGRSELVTRLTAATATAPR